MIKYDWHDSDESLLHCLNFVLTETQNLGKLSSVGFLDYMFERMKVEHDYSETLPKQLSEKFKLSYPTTVKDSKVMFDAIDDVVIDPINYQIQLRTKYDSFCDHPENDNNIYWMLYVILNDYVYYLLMTDRYK